MVQSALNQQPADRLDDIAPVTAFTGLPATPPLVGLAHQDVVQDSVQDALAVMHKNVAETGAQKRAKARKYRSGRRAVKFEKFSLGDFALVARAL
ncbi:hypothetical protein H310_14628 [Aphanomyces invadans]|uniref:Uncharacterized protein n=1 Tax=Aphanomyces invadans TaxID=157072 RepID=A0A024T8Z2_9STRA|nr:hypothetical protein H310_14628 [Aphanomyces invadans]ETV90625.1 hypothetical protein H310_14628 [Aphanomyces invadans]|eukprot:XP_008880746.1 hypothetical protein H310_14628 [Aphanomyces invadans]